MKNYFWNLIGFVLLAFIAFCVVVVCLGVWKGIKPTVRTIKAGESYLAERWIVKAHKETHGISASTYNPETGENYFWREGQKCKL